MKRGIVGVVACAASVALSVPALAVDFSGYGAVRVGTYWTQNQYYSATAGASYGARRSDSDFSLDLMGDSLVGVRVKEGDFSAVAEMGAFNPKAASSGPEVRLLFGEWDFGKGKIRVGKAPSPYVYRTQMTWDSDGGMNAYGSLWDGRYAQIKLTMNNGFYFTLMQPRAGAGSVYTSNAAGAGSSLAAFSETANTYATTYTNYNTIMPKIVTGYEGKLSNWTYGGGVSYNLYNLERVTAANATPIKTDIHSYLVFFHGKVDVAPVEFSYNLFTGRNLGDLMSSAASAYVATSATFSTTGTASYYDVTNDANAYTYGGWGQIGYTVNPKLKIYAGASYVADDNRKTHADERFAAFVNAHYQVSKNFKIVPEIGYMNDMTNTLGNKEPRTLEAGAKWEMSF
ncbi:hypothetical protein FO488_17495 [Geobacter sp. FeAm09]|uniref:hypothetical protein n=1 Tax=Geobacter sp. FeAm09 TaxID=2597769 RepID=UPI0011F064AE|nr:hypothetical protein [Geobacter sp. FeAm09]QEM69774.1 hypothetical protein FO488_17495 [Geobacter sp. FeAm09]